MTPTKKTKWRLGKLPDPSEITDLVKAEILTKEEAREILISQETEEERDKKSLQDEIKFLRELVKSLSNNSRTEIIKQIEYIEKPYRRYDWYTPYAVYCSAGNSATANDTMYLTTTGSATTNGLTVSYSNNPMDFTAVKTF